MSENICAYDRRRWWPDEYIDELVPDGRPTLDAWLTRFNDGAHAIAGDDDLLLGPIPLTEGQEVVFNWCDSLGTARIAQTDEGGMVLLPEPPAGTNHFWIPCDEDTICDTAETFLEQARDFGHGGEIATLSTWGDGIRCRFTTLNGPPRFVPLAAVPGAPADAVQPAADTQSDLLHPAEPKV